MRRSDIEAQANRVPFRVFSIETGGGSFIEVSHPSKILLPTARPDLAIVLGPDGGVHLLDLEQVVSVEPREIRMESTSTMSNWLIMRHQSVVTLTPQTKTPTSLAEREAFFEADRFSTWYAGQAEPTVPVDGGQMLISDVCRLVAQCKSPLPRSCADTLRFAEVELKTRTYSGAAHALAAAIKKVRQEQ
jgi:hypothetical protein